MGATWKELHPDIKIKEKHGGIRILDLVGYKFSHLTVTEYAGYDHNRKMHYWYCDCDCNGPNSKHIKISELNLLQNHTTSCGCEAIRIRSNPYIYEFEHRTGLPLFGTQIYDSWCVMHKRCFDPNHENYIHYHDKGITICNEWLRSIIGYNENNSPIYSDDFSGLIRFAEWSYFTPSGYNPNILDISINRINNDIGYSPNNCIWCDMFLQQSYRTDNSIIDFYEAEYTVAAIARKFNLDKDFVKNRIKYGWPIEDVLFIPDIGKNGPFGKITRKEYKETHHVYNPVFIQRPMYYEDGNTEDPENYVGNTMYKLLLDKFKGTDKDLKYNFFDREKGVITREEWIQKQINKYKN